MTGTSHIFAFLVSSLSAATSWAQYYGESQAPRTAPVPAAAPQMPKPMGGTLPPPVERTAPSLPPASPPPPTPPTPPPPPRYGASTFEQAAAATGTGGGLRFLFSYGMDNITVEMSGTPTLENQPSAEAYPDSAPLTGTFKGGVAEHYRTVASYIFASDDNTAFVLGGGFDSIAVGLTGAKLKKDGGAQSSLYLWSGLVELGVVKSITSQSTVEMALGLSSTVGGKFRSHYLSASDDAYSTIPERTVAYNDVLKGGFRGDLLGRYAYALGSGFGIGFGFGAYYGVLNFKGRAKPANYSGATLSLDLQIDFE